MRGATCRAQFATIRFYVHITTSIPYVNARPHIGHALELVQSDAIARYYRAHGHDVIFQTGTDENAFKNVLAAREHDIKPSRVSKRNFFFRLSSFQERLEELLMDNAIRIIPESRKNEVFAFVRRGLEDISISRNERRSGGWGVLVPDDPGQVNYVWIDALINYLTGQGFGTTEEWRRVWNDDVHKLHAIGKNV